MWSPCPRCAARPSRLRRRHRHRSAGWPAARAVVVIDENDQVVYSQLVNEITEEPDYDAALAALKA